MPLSYHQAEQYLLSLSNIPRKEYMKNPKDCAVYLKRLQFFLNLLGNPERKIPQYIHVTGTSGKGSVVNYLHHILTESGKKVGSLSSPHPTYITERWKIRNRVMPKKEFVSLVQKIRPILDTYIAKTPYDMISYGELMTAMGLLYFAEKKVQWVILEVGCGGRYDATNIIPKKDIAVITNIGLDHVGLLGNTKKEIAYEKAGIITKKAAVFSAEKNKEILKVIRRACKKNNAPLFHAPSSKISHVSISLEGTSFTYNGHTYTTSAIGHHQAKNAALAIDITTHLNIPHKHIQAGIQKTAQEVRCEVRTQKPIIIVDTAHNPDKMKTTVRSMQEIRGNKQIHLVVGFSENKQVRKMVAQLSLLEPKSIACTRNTINPFRRVSDPHMLTSLFNKSCPSAQIATFLDPNSALLFAKKRQSKNDIILITGSTFLGGELRERASAS